MHRLDLPRTLDPPAGVDADDPVLDRVLEVAAMDRFPPVEVSGDGDLARRGETVLVHVMDNPRVFGERFLPGVLAAIDLSALPVTGSLPADTRNQ
jgi:hypothetical protein